MVKSVRTPNFRFSSFVSSLKNCLSKGNNSFMVHYSRLNALISEYFYKNHFFSEVYYIYSAYGSFIYIRIHSFEGEFVLKNIRSFYKRSKYIFLRVDQIKRILRKEKRLLLLSTSEGILNSMEAIQLGIGGVALFEYY